MEKFEEIDVYEACVDFLCARHLMTLAQVSSILGEHTRVWDAHCVSRGSKQKHWYRRLTSFLADAMMTFPKAPPFRGTGRTQNRSLCIRYPFSQLLTWDGKGPWRKRAELRKHPLGKAWLNTYWFVYETKSTKKQFDPLVPCGTEFSPRPGQLVGTVRFTHSLHVDDYTNQQELLEHLCLSKSSFEDAKKKGYLIVWVADSSRRFMNSPQARPKKIGVVWSKTPIGDEKGSVSLEGKADDAGDQAPKKRRKYKKVKREPINESQLVKEI